MYKMLSLCFIALIFISVSGRPVTSEPRGYLKRAVLTDITILLDILPKDEGEDEGELYTPENIDVKCTREAMICYMKEIGALAQDSEERNVIKTIQRIQRNIGAALNYASSSKTTGRNSSQPSEPFNMTLTPFISRREKDTSGRSNVCPMCESHELQKTTTFLQRMIQFVQFALNNGLKKLG